MSQLRSPIIWRLTIWFLVLSLIPIAIVVMFIQRQVRDNIITTQLEIIRDHAHIYSARMEIEPDKEQAFAEDMMNNTANGDAFFLIAVNGTYLAHSNPEKIGRSALEDFNFDTLQKLLARETTTILDNENGLLIGSYRTTLTNPLAVSVGNIEENGGAQFFGPETSCCNYFSLTSGVDWRRHGGTFNPQTAGKTCEFRY
ncbi:MAG: hypothetical protein IPN58_16075 [Anaerolineales bacterium]|nr:hypothetical protein [Anaerolineales bacterium]